MYYYCYYYSKYMQHVAMIYEDKVIIVYLVEDWVKHV